MNNKFTYFYFKIVCFIIFIKDYIYIPITYFKSDYGVFPSVTILPSPTLFLSFGCNI